MANWLRKAATADMYGNLEIKDILSLGKTFDEREKVIKGVEEALGLKYHTTSYVIGEIEAKLDELGFKHQRLNGDVYITSVPEEFLT